jgi:signal transduction histidine kinase
MPRPSLPFVVVLAVLPLLGMPARAASPEPVRSIAAVLDLPITELSRGRPAVVRGTATFLRSHSLVLQDGEDAIFITRRSTRDVTDQALTEAWLKIPLGAVVEVEGIVEPGGYAPTIIASSSRVVSPGELPSAVPADVGRLFSGADDNRRVELRGVVQGLDRTVEADSWRLLVEAASRRLVVELPKELFPDDPAGLIDAEVRATGVVAAFRNIRGEFIAPRLCIARPEDLTVITPPAAPPFESPLVPLDAIARFRVRPLGGHRLRTAGVVSFATAESLYLQEGMGGVRVDLANDETVEFEPLRAGDRVEVAGFLDMGRRIGGIVGAVVRRLATENPPEPLRIQPSEIVASHEASHRAGEISPVGSYDGRLVRCRALVEAINPLPEGVLVSLADGDTQLTAELPPTAVLSRLSPRLTPGAEVELTGIVRLDLAAEQVGGLTVAHPRLEQLNLLVRGAGDIVVVHAAPWWTVRRLALAAAALAALVVALAAASVAWVTLLRREVARQTALAVSEATARREAALEYEVGLRERSRLAANLHDTILQTVTGIGFQLKACEVSRRREDADRADGTVSEAAGSGGHLSVAQKMVDHAAGQLRSTVWSLRSLPTDDRLFSVALRELADRHSAGHETHIDLSFDAVADRLPAFIAGNLLLVMQEALHNALHHAEPQTITMSVTASGEAGMVTSAVRDDGAGFLVGSQAGPTQGHFGLAGMRERMERLGGRLEIASQPGEGTTVTAVVPLVPVGWSVDVPDAARQPADEQLEADTHGRPLPVRTMSPASADSYTSGY